MTKLSVIEESVLQHIPIGSIRKISIKELSYLNGLDERSIYEIINSLRKKGAPICAKRNGEPHDRGYYIATNEDERTAGLQSYKEQAREMQSLIHQIEGASLESWCDDLVGHA